MFINRARARTGTSKGYSHTIDVVDDDKLLELVDVFRWTIQSVVARYFHSVACASIDLLPCDFHHAFVHTSFKKMQYGRRYVVGKMSNHSAPVNDSNSKFILAIGRLSFEA